MPMYFPGKRKPLALAILLAASGSVVIAQEQDADAEAAQATAAEQTTQGEVPRRRRAIEEVVVTAERREASIQDTSISITAMDAGFVEDFGIRDQDDFQNFIPATTIQPYDAAIRGVGRNFRNLGGDPGVAVYINEVYSEDLYTATAGGFWDLERVEVLRGPQGTLYGRNAVGGAMNFIYQKPSNVFEAAAKTIVGSEGTFDLYGVISGPIIEDLLSARLTASSRERDGLVEDIGLGDDLDSIDNDNVALSLRFTPTDEITVDLRANDLMVDRITGGATGAGLVVLSEEGGPSRNFEAPVFGYREIDRSQTDFTARNFFLPGAPVFNFTDPVTGRNVEAQYLRGGIDAVNPVPGELNEGMPNQGFGLSRDPSQCVFFERDGIEGENLCTATNGVNYEKFDQQGVQFKTEWAATDALSIAYIFGYTDYLYERSLDDDLTASLAQDRNFYVNHEADYLSHEVQFFYEIGDNLNFTTGLFAYDSEIAQRGDFFSVVEEARYLDAAPDLAIPLGPFPAGANVSEVFFGPAAVDLFSAERAAQEQGAANGELIAVTGSWQGDMGTGVENGPITNASDLKYDTKTERKAYAAYTQGVWDISPEFTLTFGARWARDELEGTENLWRYTEFNAAGFGLPVLFYNIGTGALDPVTLQPTGAAPVAYQGVPLSLSVHRSLDRADEAVTGRLNLDWHISEDIMTYYSVTTGYRAGGFNLVFFSQTAEYDPEELVAYEIGYKGQHLDRSLQVNGAIFYYDYENIHTFGAEPSLAGGTSTSVLEAPGARVYGIEGEVLWLATDNLTLGTNFSYTPNEYTEDLLLSDVADPDVPISLFDPLALTYNINGNQLLQVPEGKATAWGSYAMPLGQYGNLELLSAVSWIDDVYFTAFESERDMAPSYTRWDARLTWTSVEQNWSASAFVDNITDEVGIRQILRNGQSQGWRRMAQFSDRRLYGLELSYTFGS
ncbi:TonB-dependent receptor [Proteobacteria bacterium 005FR1]|nr:TonB-dependent receptor [Proteobacteria bacterium 005FR1]